MDSYVPNIQLGIYTNLSILIFLISQDFGRSPAYLQRMRAEAADEARRLVKVKSSNLESEIFSFEGILHQIIMITIILIRWQEEQDAEQRRKDAMKLGDEERETILQVHVVIIPKSTVVNQVLNSSSYSTRHIRVNLLVDQNQRGRC